MKMKLKIRMILLLLLAFTWFLYTLGFLSIFGGSFPSKDVYERAAQQIITSANDDALSDPPSERDVWFESMTKRKTRADTYCIAHNKSVRQTIGDFYLYEPKHIAYCEVPKAGCTFWKRIMRFLNKDFVPWQTNITKPSDISRSNVHMRNLKTMPRFKLGTKMAAKLQTMDNTFMFTRDPYSRLWSAYLDKLFLPDFWQYGGTVMIRSERREPDPMSLKCGYDVTFLELMQYLVRHPGIDVHFQPIHRICDPCQTKFKFIGKQESFRRDATFIINEVGITDSLGKDVLIATVEDEIKSISTNYLTLPYNHTCYNKTLICERLWQAFQMNGYIGFENSFPLHLAMIKPENIMKEFIKTAIETRKSGKSLHERWKLQRRHSLINAYRAIPKSIIYAFQEIFRADFEIFDYDIEPEDIFGTSATKIDI